MKDSEDKEHRISNLKNMINNIKEEDAKKEESESYDNHEEEEEDIEEDDELIEYLNMDPVDYDELEIDDEFIYHPGDENGDAVNLEEDQIDNDFIITPNIEDSEDDDEIDDFNEDIVGDISGNFDTVINAKIGGKPILSIVSTFLGIILIIISIFIFQSRSDRVIDNVVAGESSFMFIIFLAIGALLLIYGICKLLNIKNPLEAMAMSLDSIENDNKPQKNTENIKIEKPSQNTLPKSNIPLDKDSYKIGEFNLSELKKTLKKSTSSKNDQKNEEEEISENDESSQKDGLTAKEIEEIEYEQVKLENESIDEIFAEVEEIDELPIISIDSKEKEEE